MTISLFIPTTPNHFIYVDEILQKYVDGTILPDEMVVSISNSHLMEQEIIDRVEEKYKDYNLKVLKHKQIMKSGPNRQLSKTECSSDIITYSDSDDYPHKQRIEVIKYFFENYDILHLNHSYYFYQPNNNDPKKGSGTWPDTVNKFTDEEFNFKENVRFTESDYLYQKYFPGVNCKNLTDNYDKYFYSNIAKFNCYGSTVIDYPIHSGCPSIKKEVLNKITWIDMVRYEDFKFNMETLYYFNKSLLLDLPIYYYRH